MNTVERYKKRTLSQQKEINDWLAQPVDTPELAEERRLFEVFRRRAAEDYQSI